MKIKKSKKCSTFRKHWTAAEDAAISQLVGDGENVKWNNVAEQLACNFGLEGRSGKQCRERWHNHLDPQINKGAWSTEEQHILFSYHKDYGNTWAQIGNSLVGRSENSIKNQFYSALRRQFKKWKGYEPTRNQLKKYDAFLTTQILSHLAKRIKIKRREQNEEKEIRTLDDFGPVETCSIASNGTRDQDLFDSSWPIASEIDNSLF